MRQLDDVVSALLSLGGRPPGDPLHMSEQADRLRHCADRLSTAMGLLTRQATIPYFEGPQADLHRQDVEEHGRTLQGLIAQMISTADALSRQAARVGDEQVAWDRSFDHAVTGVPSQLLHEAKRKLGWR